MVLLREFAQGVKGTIGILQQEILFVVRGGGRITMEHTHISRTLERGEFVFLPGGSRWACDFVEETTLMMIRMVVDSPECHVLRIAETTDCPEEFLSKPYALSANERMWHFIHGLQQTIADGFRCRLYMQTEVLRMLFLLHAYYSPQECARFFAHILTTDIKFSEFVRANHMKYKTVKEMADGLFMTSQAFSNRFKKVFGTTPHKWMQREKARQIYLDICRGEMPLKEIVIKYDFPLPSNFFRFCKQTFGESPGNIRKGLQKMTSPTGEEENPI